MTHHSPLHGAPRDERGTTTMAAARPLTCAIGCSLVPQAMCESCTPSCGTGRTALALRKTVVDPTTSRYASACAVNFAYALGIVLVDIYAWGGYLVNGEPVDTGAYAWSASSANRAYIALAVVHFVNAWQFAWAWHGRSWLDVVLWPEYLNITGACLYLVSASLYQQSTDLIDAASIPADGSDDYYSPAVAAAVAEAYLHPTVMRVHHLETAAAVIEVVASVGWGYTWWLTYVR